MKKIILLTAVTLFMAATAFGGNSKADLFSYDKKEVQSDFKEINKVEQYVSAHQDATLHDVQTFYDVNGLNNQSDEMALLFDLDDMEWGSFAWGFCCWPVGFFVVGINDSKSQDEKTSYWIGTGTVVLLNGITVLATPTVYTY